jgi:hypothetical protein
MSTRVTNTFQRECATTEKRKKKRKIKIVYVLFFERVCAYCKEVVYQLLDQ